MNFPYVAWELAKLAMKRVPCADVGNGVVYGKGPVLCSINLQTVPGFRSFHCSCEISTTQILESTLLARCRTSTTWEQYSEVTFRPYLWTYSDSCVPSSNPCLRLSHLDTTRTGYTASGVSPGHGYRLFHWTLNGQCDPQTQDTPLHRSVD